MTTSYIYNAHALYRMRFDELSHSSVTVVMGDHAWGSTRPDLPADDLYAFTNDRRVWWHPQAFRNRKLAIVFLDGHARFTPVQILVPNTETYRRDP